MATCTETVQLLKDKLLEQDQMLKEILDAPKAQGLIVHIHGDRARIASQGTLLDALIPEHLRADAFPGYTALLLQDGGIADIHDSLAQPGPVVTVRNVISHELVEVTHNGESLIVFSLDIHPAIGDRVQLDHTRNAVLRYIPTPPAPVETPTVERVTFDQIGGLAHAKQAIEEAVIWPLAHRALLEAYGQRPAKGLLFYGPPGCGKTMLAKATATALADHGTPGFFAVRGPELLNAYVGETERQIRELFAKARDHQTTHDTRAVVFIDEADAILAHRGRALHSDLCVPAFLVEMDGIDATLAPLVILATNRADDLDEAVIREGRVDRRIRIDRPELKDVQDLFTLYLTTRPVADPLETLATGGAAALFNSSLWPQRSGAQVAALVDRATNVAMRRDLTKKAKQPTGITLQDCADAIQAAATTHTLQH